MSVHERLGGHARSVPCADGRDDGDPAAAGASFRGVRKLLAAVLLGSMLVAAPAADAAKHGRVLATGDSMIQIVDGFLGGSLARQHFRVRSDAHIGTGITKPFQLDWPRHAAHIARAYRPSASVVFLGANDGFPLRWHGRQRQCCSRAWRKAYAARARTMMRSLERGGAARVYWLTLPAARPRLFHHVFKSVNLALSAAARREGERVRLIDMGRVFTPTGRFQQTIVRHGRRLSVRQEDGVHLNVTGARIAARVVVRRMRRDHLFR